MIQLPGLRTMLLGMMAGLVLLIPSDAVAQETCSGNGNYRVRLNPAVIDYGIVSSVDLDAGQIVMGRMRVRIRPRRNDDADWALCLRANAAAFGPSGKLIDDLEWQVAGSPIWQPVSTGGQLISQGTGTQRVDVFFRMLVAWEDGPGDYSAPIAFIAASQ
jgi:hypothetical protein